MESYTLPFHPPAYTSVHLALLHPIAPSLCASLLSRIISVSRLPSNTSSSSLSSQQRSVDYAFLDASRLTSRQHVLTAVQQAIVAASRDAPFAEGGLKTRTVHSEIIYRLGGNNNVSQALKDFGMSPQTTSLLLVRVSNGGEADETPEAVLAAIGKLLRDAERGVVEGSAGEQTAQGAGAVAGDGSAEGGSSERAPPLAPLSLLGTKAIGFDPQRVRRVYKIEDGEGGQGTDGGQEERESQALDRIVCSLVALKGVA